MAKIIIDVNKKEYTLELNRAEIKRAEGFGLKVKDFENSPQTQMSNLFKASLHKNHPELNGAQCDELLDAYANEGGDIEDLMSNLLELYTSFFSTTQATIAKKARVEK